MEHRPRILQLYIVFLLLLLLLTAIGMVKNILLNSEVVIVKPIKNDRPRLFFFLGFSFFQLILPFPNKVSDRLKIIEVRQFHR